MRPSPNRGEPEPLGQRLDLDEGSCSKAAKKLNRAQSAVTSGVQKLEAQVGLPLFDRTPIGPG